MLYILKQSTSHCMGHVFYYLPLIFREFGRARVQVWGWDSADSSSPRVGIAREMQQEQDKQHQAPGLGRERQLSVCWRKQTSFMFFSVLHRAWLVQSPVIRGTRQPRSSRSCVIPRGALKSSRCLLEIVDKALFFRIIFASPAQMYYFLFGCVAFFIHFYY